LHEFLSSGNIGFHDSMKRSTSEDFNGNYRKLAAFKKRFGHCRVPSNWREDRELASWLDCRRNRWDRLTMDELAELFTLGVRFGYRPDQWIARMVDLKVFRAENGHINISQYDPVHGGLGRWCSKKRGQREKLSPGQIRLMDELGFVWDPFQARYQERLEELRIFQRQHGHCDVASGHLELGHLASWIFNIRAAAVSLPDWVRRELDKLGFDFRSVWERQWEERFAEAKRFQEKHGHLRAPRGAELATWINEQRHNRSPLSEERRKRLEEIGFDWDPQETAWNRQFADLERFKRKHGHCNVPGQYPENPRLGAWVNFTRMKAQKLSPKRRQRLEAIGFVWSVNGPNPHHSWEWWYEKLVKFHRRHGHCRVSEHSGPDIALGSWVSRMRTQRPPLSKTRRQLLDKIGFSWTPFETVWGQNYRQLAEFKIEHGHCNVPLAYPENPSLGVWLANQRAKYSRGVLNPERERMLAALGVVWDMAEEQWSQRLEELRAFKRRFGHCNVSSVWKENPELARWVARMRARKDRQSKERIECLDELGFEWRPTKGRHGRLE